MKIFKILAVALVAMLGFTACNKECGHEFIEYDHSEALIGTWTYIAENGQAEAMVINPDGTFTTTGVAKGGYLYEEKGTIKVVNNKVSLVFEGDTEAIEGRLELVAGKSMSIVINEQYGVRLDYDYCANDLADEVVGMWVCNNVTWMDADMAINVYQADGKAYFTGFVGNAANGYEANVETRYKVIGDLMFQSNPMSYEGAPQYLVFRLNYSPNATELGDVLTNTTLMAFGDEVIEMKASMLRIKQYLELEGNKYDYIKTFVTNVKGADKDVEFMGYTFNFSKMDGVVLDKMLKTVLFAVQFPDANTIRYTCQYNDFNMEMDAPIEVDGNKMTIKMSERDAAYKDVDLYTFQDQDNTQMHMYMPTYAFETFFANMQIAFMSELGQLDKTDAAAVEEVFNSIDEAVETINLSLVMTKAVIK